MHLKFLNLPGSSLCFVSTLSCCCGRAENLEFGMETSGLRYYQSVSTERTFPIHDAEESTLGFPKKVAFMDVLKEQILEPWRQLSG